MPALPGRSLFNMHGREEGGHVMEAVSYAARATDQRATYLRIYADADGETHMQEIDVSLLPEDVFNGYPPLRLSDTLTASGWRFCRVPAGMHEVDWHNRRAASW
jgi:hypothetical protein